MRLARAISCLAFAAGLYFCTGSAPGAQASELGTPARCVDCSVPQQTKYCIQPRSAWERLGTRIILRSKAWLGLHIDRQSTDGIRVVVDVPYGSSANQQVDLYLPRGQGFPLLVFIH